MKRANAIGPTLMAMVVCLGVASAERSYISAAGDALEKLQPTQAAQVGKIDAHALHTLLQLEFDMTVLDTRTKEWTDERRIGGAKVLTSETSDEDIRAALSEKDGLLVVYCGSTRCPLASKMAERLTEMGYKNILYYPDGIAGWEEAEYPFDQVVEAP